MAPVRRILWMSAQADFNFNELDRQPDEHLAPLDDHCIPLKGASHGWDSAELDPAADVRTSVASLTASYRDGSSNPVEVLEHLLARVEAGRFGSSHHSPFINLDTERALEDARSSADRYATGKQIGPLDGVPVPVKDEQDMEGLPTLGGTSYRHQLASRDAWGVRQLKRAGALVFAKTHATEWGLNPWGGNAHNDMPRNPWKAEHAAGGSSTGSGAAVALGFCPGAIGSDGGGSIRIPSALNGVMGLKPTFVRIGRTGDPWAPGTMSHLGPLGGTAGDLVEVLAATAGPDPEDRGSAVQPWGPEVPDAWRAALRRGVRGCRIGVIEAEWADASGPVAEAGRQALAELERDGAVLVPIDFGLRSVVKAIGALTIGSETAAALEEDLRQHGASYGPELVIILRTMQGLSAGEFIRVARMRAALRRQVATLFSEQVDLIALPSVATVAPPYPLSTKGDIIDSNITAAMTRYAFLANLTGLPSGSAPTGVHEGLPTAIQFMGDAWDEASVLAAMAHGERQGWARIGVASSFEDLLG